MRAVNILKTLLMNLQVLALSRTAGQYTVSTDACDSQVDFVILHEDDGTERSVGYWSLTLISAEQKLATAHKEFLPAV